MLARLSQRRQQSVWYPRTMRGCPVRHTHTLIIFLGMMGGEGGVEKPSCCSTLQVVPTPITYRWSVKFRVGPKNRTLQGRTAVVLELCHFQAPLSIQSSALVRIISNICLSISTRQKKGLLCERIGHDCSQLQQYNISSSFICCDKHNKNSRDRPYEVYIYYTWKRWQLFTSTYPMHSCLCYLFV